MNQWQSLLERFLRNESTNRENKIVFHALRDGLIDDELRRAIDIVMNFKVNEADINLMKPLSDKMLNNIRSRMKKRKTKTILQQRIVPEWFKIAAAIVITFSISWLTFHPKKSNETPTATMNTIFVPSGQTVNLTLSDGTNIYLNARTTLKYPDAFSGNEREIFLEGEGFFDVAYNREKPFIVHAAGYDIRALGTQFNVEAYSQSNNFNVSLLEGSVQVTLAIDSSHNLILQPNTIVRLHEGRLVSEAITDFNHFRWREGLISFDNMPFTKLMTKFEKCYGIEIVVQNDHIKYYAPTGKFRKIDGIDYALRVLQRDFRFRFERDEENHVIYIK